MNCILNYIWLTKKKERIILRHHKPLSTDKCENKLNCNWLTTFCSLATTATPCLQNCTSNFSAWKTCKNNISAWFHQQWFPQHMRRSLSDSRSSTNLILHLISAKSTPSPQALCSHVKEALAEAGKLHSVIQCNAIFWMSWTSLGSGGSRDRSALHSSWTN